MECRNCKFLSEPEYFGEDKYPSVRCTVGLWDKPDKTYKQKLGEEPRMIPQWYSYGQTRLNRGPVKIGATCTEGKPK